ncbi:MAG: hypothetical protein LBQ60_11700 [Bacteroidales bacterium]|jgi:hypothetical protein|nr:hypothetical protein [Bacteroidales bacterium]
MGKQINFYLHSKDLESFFEILRKRKAVFLPGLYPENKLEKTEHISIEKSENMFLARMEDLDKIKLKELAGINTGQWTIDRYSPVMDLDSSREIPELRVITRGRLYFQSDYYMDSKLVRKDENFVKWADSLLSVLRRKLIKRTEIGGFTGTFYLGQYAEEWVEQNNVKVDSGGSRLIINEDK